MTRMCFRNIFPSLLLFNPILYLFRIQQMQFAIVSAFTYRFAFLMLSRENIDTRILIIGISMILIIIEFEFALVYIQTSKQLPENLFSLQKSNAYSAIINEIYSFKYGREDQGDAVLFLIHLLGDIMQPMHVTQLVSEENLSGDKGGLKYKLQGTSKRNLHMYTDNLADLIPRKQV